MKREKGKCRICRRVGTKLFLKGEKCYSQKCPFILRPYPPGEKGKRRKGPPSEYAKLLKEVQKLKAFYGLRKRDLKRYVKDAIEEGKRGKDIGLSLLEKLEMRLDNIVWRMGFANSKRMARQLVSHGFFEVNGKKVNIPSYKVKEGDTISLRKEKLNKKIVEKLKENLKKAKVPSFLEIDSENLRGKIISPLKVEELVSPFEIRAAIELYSR